MPAASLDSHIELTPSVGGGRPRIAGRRIRVQDIAIWHVLQGQSVASISDEYHLTPAEVYAALAYYFDHKQEIDDAMARDVVFEEEMKKKHPSHISPEVRAAFLKSMQAEKE